MFSCFGGALETMVRDQLAPPFEKATGCKVVLSVGTALSNLAKFQAAKDRPTIDVYWSNELTHAAGTHGWDHEGIEIFELVPPELSLDSEREQSIV